MNDLHRLNRRAFIATGVSLAAAALGENPAAARKFKLNVSQARSVAVTPDDLVVIAADRSLFTHRLNGDLVRETKTPRPVRAVCAHRDGLFVTFRDQVARVNANGDLRLIGGQFGNEAALTGIAVANDGRVFAADSAQRVVWRLDPSGKVLGQIRAGASGFAVPRAFFPIAWQRDHLIVAEPGRHQIHRYTADGELVSTWGRRSREAEGFTGCCNPVAIATAADGSVFTAERGLARVKRFDAAGSLSRQLAGPEEFAAFASEAEDAAGDLFGCEGGLFDIASTADGRMIILDRTALEVHVLA